MKASSFKGDFILLVRERDERLRERHTGDRRRHKHTNRYRETKRQRQACKQRQRAEQSQTDRQAGRQADTDKQADVQQSNSAKRHVNKKESKMKIKSAEHFEAKSSIRSFYFELFYLLSKSTSFVDNTMFLRGLVPLIITHLNTPFALHRLIPFTVMN